MRNFLSKKGILGFKKGLSFSYLFFSNSKCPVLILVCLLMFSLPLGYGHAEEVSSLNDKEDKDTLEFLEKTVNFLQEENENIQKERDSFLDEIQKQKVIINEHKISINHLLNEIKNVKEQRADYKLKTEDLDKKVLALDLEKKSLLKQAETVKEEVTKLKDDFVNLRKEKDILSNEKTDWQTRSAKNSEQIAVINQENSGKLKEREDQIKAVSCQLAALTKQVNINGEENANLKNSIEKSQKLVSNLENENRGNLAMIEDLRREVKKQQDLTAKIKVQELDKLNKEKAALTDTLDNYRKLLSASKDSYKQIEGEKKEILDKLKKMRETLDETRERNKELEQDKLDSAVKIKDIEGLKSELAKASEEKQAQQQAAAQLKGEIERYKSLIVEKDSQSKDLLKQKASEVNSIAEKYKIALAEMEGKLEQSSREKQDLARELVNVKNDAQIKDEFGAKITKQWEKDIAGYKGIIAQKESQSEERIKQARADWEDSVNSKIDSLEKAIQSAKNANEGLEKEKRVLLETVDDYKLVKDELKSAKDEKLRILDEVKSLKNELDNHKKMLAENEKTAAAEFNSKTAELNNVIGEYKLAMNKTMDELNQAKEDKQKIQKEINDAVERARLTAKINASLEKERQDIILMIEDTDKIKNEFKKTDKQNKEYADRIDFLTKETQKYKVSLAERDNEIKDMKDKLAKTIDENKASLIQAKAQVKSLQEEKFDISAQFARMQEDVTVTKQITEQIEKEKESAVVELARLKKEWQLAAQQNGRLEEEKQEALVKIDDLNKFKNDFIRIEKENSDYASKIKLLTEEGDKSKKISAGKDEEIQQIKNRLTSISDESSISLTQIKEKLAVLQTENRDISNTLSLSQKDLQIASERGLRLQSEKQELIEKVRELASAAEELKLVKDQKQEFLGKMNVLQSKVDKYKNLLAKKDSQDSKKFTEEIVRLQNIEKSANDLRLDNEALKKANNGFMTEETARIKTIKSLGEENLRLKDTSAKETAALKETINGLRKEKGVFSSKMLVLEDELKQKELIFTKERDILIEKVQNLNEVENKLKKLEADNSKYLAKIEELEKEKERNAQAFVKNLEDTKQELSSMVKSLENENKTVLSEKEEWLKKITVLNKERENILDKFAREEDQGRNIIAQLQQEKVQYSKQLAELEGQLQQHKNMFIEKEANEEKKFSQEKDKLISALKEYKSALDKAQNGLEQSSLKEKDYIDRIAELEQNLTSIKETAIALEKEKDILAKKAQTVDSIEAEFNEIRDKMQKYPVQITALEEEKQRLSQVLAQTRAEFEDKLKKEIAAAVAAANNQYAVSLEQVSNQLKEANLKNINFAKKEQVFKETIKEMQEGEPLVGDVIDDLKAAKLQEEKYAAKIKELSKDVETLQSRINDLQEEKEVFAKKTDDLQTAVKDYESRGEESRKYLAAIDVLQKEIGRYRKLLKDEKSQNIAGISDNQQQLKERICYLEAKCADFSKEKEELVKSYEAEKFYATVSLKKENARLRQVLAKMTSRFESKDELSSKYYSEANAAE